MTVQPNKDRHAYIMPHNNPQLNNSVTASDAARMLAMIDSPKRRLARANADMSAAHAELARRRDTKRSMDSATARAKHVRASQRIYAADMFDPAIHRIKPNELRLLQFVLAYGDAGIDRRQLVILADIHIRPWNPIHFVRDSVYRLKKRGLISVSK